MPAFTPFRALLPAAIAVAAAALAASCGGSFDSNGSTGGVTPGEPCARSGMEAEARDGCNTCTCSGGEWACTEKACVAEDGGSAQCQPGAARDAEDGCNTCTCTEDGTWACTRMACGVCQPGDTMNDGCNECSCVDGQWACPDRACPPPPQCMEGETRYDGCNTCTCMGGMWGCTARACPPPECVEGESMYDGCNTCTCSGGAWACTDRACPPPPPPACIDGETTYDGCNTCTCSGGLWSCTLRACPPVDGGAVGCGGWLGNTCSSTEYCAYVEGQHCGAADASSVCQPRPQACDLVYDPVCGCDGKTYGNDCEAAASGTGVLGRGPC